MRFSGELIMSFRLGLVEVCVVCCSGVCCGLRICFLFRWYGWCGGGVVLNCVVLY